MLRNYFKTALRAFRRRPGSTAINVIGLALGFAASIVIALYAQHELTYDAFHDEADDIYQVYKERDTPSGTQVARDTWVPMLPRLKATYPSVESGVRIYPQQQWVQRGEQRIEAEVAYVDSTLLEVFTFPLRRGSAASALDDPGSAVITPEVAEQHFGDADPIGQTLTVNFDTEVTVTGVLEPIPTNSTLQFDVAIPIQASERYREQRDDWGNSFLFTVVQLQDGASPGDLEAQFPQLIASVFGEEETERTRFRLQPLTTLQDALTGNRDVATILLIIAGAILLIAAMNFMNLAAAQSLGRAREIGVRKSLGALEKQLAGQFLGEAVLMSLGGFAVGAVLAQLVLPVFNGLYDVELSLGLLSNPARGAVSLGIAVAVGLIAGSYPAAILSRFDPSAVMRGSHETSASGLLVRKGLVVVQFALSMILIVGTLAAWQQIDHLQSARTGVDAEQLVAVETSLQNFGDPRAAQSRLQTFEQEVERISGVASASFSSHVPGNWPGSFAFVYPGNASSDETRQRMRFALVDPSYFETHGISRTSGRAFSQERAADSSAVVLNRAAVEAFGWSSVSGKQVQLGPDTFDVIGVVENYRFQSAASEVAPVVHLNSAMGWGMAYQNLTVRLQSADARSVLDQMQALWGEVDATRPLPYTFVDDRFRQLYESEERLATVVSAFTGLAIIIACLGLLGLAALSVTRRQKEIGIRKALGATVASVTASLSRDFLTWVAVALVLAIPAAYLLLEGWLQDFATRIDLGPGLFLGAAAVAFVVAAATVATQTLRAARLDPATTLRDE
jgi:putative ABC transport system permease protein